MGEESAGWELSAGSPCQSQLEELQALRGVKAEIQHSHQQTGPCAEQEEGKQAPPSRECNQQDREVRSEFPRDDHERLDCHVVCRSQAHVDTGEDG